MCQSLGQNIHALHVKHNTSVFYDLSLVHTVALLSLISICYSDGNYHQSKSSVGHVNYLGLVTGKTYLHQLLPPQRLPPSQTSLLQLLLSPPLLLPL